MKGTEVVEKTIYTLSYYSDGKPVESTTTTDFHLAQKEYQQAYRATGITPRVYINGVNQTIIASDQLFGLAAARDTNKPKTQKPKYCDKHHIIAGQKTRSSQKNDRRSGRV